MGDCRETVGTGFSDGILFTISRQYIFKRSRETVSITSKYCYNIVVRFKEKQVTHYYCDVSHCIVCEAILVNAQKKCLPALATTGNHKRNLGPALKRMAVK